MKMELIDGSETSAIRTQTPANYPKVNILHIEYVILTAYPRQQLLRERASMLRYTYFACLVCVGVCMKELNPVTYIPPSLTFHHPSHSTTPHIPPSLTFHHPSHSVTPHIRSGINFIALSFENISLCMRNVRTVTAQSCAA